jgi:hypothetical protein
VAVGTVAGVLLSVSAVHRTPVEPRQPGVWAFSHMVRPLPGWSVQGRTLERDCAPTRLRAAGVRSRSAPRAPPGYDGCRVTRTRFGLALGRPSTPTASGAAEAERCCGGSTRTPPW